MEKEALQFLGRFSEKRNKFVSWSGGLDSTVVLHLALRAWNDFTTIFIDTGITIPETLQYVEKMSKEWGLNLVILKPKIDFWDYVKRNGFPMIKVLWCQRKLKMEPLRDFYRTVPGHKIQAIGIRKAESTMRKHRYNSKIMLHSKIKDVSAIHPILDWNKRDVLAYCKKHGIPQNPSYRYYSTSGCYYCPFIRNKRHYLVLRMRHPELFQKIVEAEDAMRNKGTAWIDMSAASLSKQGVMLKG